MSPYAPPASTTAPRWVGVAFWVWPLVASLCFVAGVLLWAYRADQMEQQLRRSRSSPPVPRFRVGCHYPARLSTSCCNSSNSIISSIISSSRQHGCRC